MLGLHEIRRTSDRPISRRTMLTAGACGFAGLTLANLLRAESTRPAGARRRSIINIHLDGMFH